MKSEGNRSRLRFTACTSARTCTSYNRAKSMLSMIFSPRRVRMDSSIPSDGASFPWPTVRGGARHRAIRQPLGRWGESTATLALTPSRRGPNVQALPDFLVEARRAGPRDTRAERGYPRWLPSRALPSVAARGRALGHEEHPQLLDHRAHRPRKDHALRPPPGAHGRPHPARDDRAVPRLHGPGAGARHHDHAAP